MNGYGWVIPIFAALVLGLLSAVAWARPLSGASPRAGRRLLSIASALLLGVGARFLLGALVHHKHKRGSDKRQLVATLPVLLLLVTLPAVTPQRGEARGAHSAIRIGLVETLGQGVPPGLVLLAMRPFKALMEAQTGLTGEVVLGGDAFALGKKLHDDQVQVAVFHGHEYAWAKMKYPRLQPVALCVNKHRRIPVHLVVRDDSKARSYADLEGKVVSLPRLAGAHCRIYCERRCIKPGVAVEKFYKKIDAPFECEDALDDVVDGVVAAVVVDAAALEEFRKDKPGRGRRLRTLAESEAFPCSVIAYHEGGLSPNQLRKLRSGLLNAPSTARGRETLKTLRLTAFETPGRSFSAQMKAIAQAYPPPAPSK
jgi:ABC-type phosphate/phosphonate transport system substrate-binding protein